MNVQVVQTESGNRSGKEEGPCYHGKPRRTRATSAGTFRREARRSPSANPSERKGGTGGV